MLVKDSGLKELIQQRTLELRASEARFHNIVSISTDGIVIVDNAGKVLFVNPAAKSLFGRKAEELLGEQFGFPIVAGETTELDIANKEGKRTIAEMRVVAAEWERKPACLATLHDITERKQAEERISEVIRQQQAILDNIPSIAWLKDRKGRYIAVNGPFGTTFNVAPKDLVGKNDHDIYPPERAAKYEKDSKEVMTTRTRAQFEESIVDQEGKTQHLEKIETPIFNDAGAVIGTIGIVNDITSSKELEITLRNDSTHDILTGLYNRAFFDAELERFAHGRMYPVSIVMADVNGLKTVNDTLGHEAGDNLIRMAARIILRAFRVEDIVARIGGDEFTVLLPGTDKNIAEEAVKRIMSCPEIINGLVSIAFGIATAENKDQLPEALKRSDERMYRNKSGQKES
jgi:diguanylate cyclase (GGDEF)-like protein/PAS domain S-box-containing protein